MKTYKILFSTILFLLFLSGKVYAVPAFPHLIKKVQPNGEEITLKMKGNEKIKWMESEDGYSLLYNKDKYIVYAIQNEKGDMIPSYIIAQDKEKRSPEIQNLLQKIPKNIQFSHQQKETLRQIGQLTLRSSSNVSKATVGKINAICALIEFPDKPYSHTVEEFDQLMNQIGYINGNQRGSVRDFYLENSYEKLDLIVTVVGPYRVKNNYAYYGRNDSNGFDQHSLELAKEAADFVFKDPLINPQNYDNNGDGFIDTFHFLYAGYGEEAGADDNCIWAHKSNFQPSFIYGNTKLSTYSCSPELRGNVGNSITYIGVICHELCHILGSPDYYDTDEDDSGGYFSGTGHWDLMADGSWNNNGATPAHINMFQKIRFGWVDPIELSSSQRIDGMPNSVENPSAYLINTSNTSEYYILENRQQVGFDANIPGNGLLIYHINYQQEHFDQNTVNNSYPQGVYPVCAGSSYKVPTGSPSSYGNINSAACVFGGNSFLSKSNFSDDTTPAATLFSGERFGKSITDIQLNAGLISFNFNVENSNLNLKASVDKNQVTLRWDIPDTGKTIKGYTIYKNDEFILFSTQNTYRETLKSPGEYRYGVSTLFDDYESEIENVTVNINWTGIEPYLVHSEMIYPNPVEKGKPIHIQLKEENIPAELLFYTLSGQLVLKEMVYTQQSQSIINLPTGIYILQIKQGRHISTLKFTVK